MADALSYAGTKLPIPGYTAVDLAREQQRGEEARLARKQAQQDKSLSSALGGIETTGVRKPDQEMIANQYRELSELVAKNPDAVTKVGTPEWKEFEEKKNALRQNVHTSLKIAEYEKSISPKLQDPSEGYHPAAVENFRIFQSSPMTDIEGLPRLPKLADPYKAFDESVNDKKVEKAVAYEEDGFIKSHSVEYLPDDIIRSQAMNIYSMPDEREEIQRNYFNAPKSEQDKAEAEAIVNKTDPYLEWFINNRRASQKESITKATIREIGGVKGNQIEQQAVADQIIDGYNSVLNGENLEPAPSGLEYNGKPVFISNALNSFKHGATQVSLSNGGKQNVPLPVNTTLVVQKDDGSFQAAVVTPADIEALQAGQKDLASLDWFDKKTAYPRMQVTSEYSIGDKGKGSSILDLRTEQLGMRPNKAQKIEWGARVTHEQSAKELETQRKYIGVAQRRLVEAMEGMLSGAIDNAEVPVKGSFLVENFDFDPVEKKFKNRVFKDATVTVRRTDDGGELIIRDASGEYRREYPDMDLLANDIARFTAVKAATYGGTTQPEVKTEKGGVADPAKPAINPKTNTPLKPIGDL
jgi:hypothetical protein